MTEPRKERVAYSKKRSNGGYIATDAVKCGITSSDNIYNNICIYQNGNPNKTKK